MNNSFVPDLTPVVVAVVLVDLLAVLVAVGVLAPLVTGFVRTHHAARVRRHEGLFSYYGHLAHSH